MVNIISHYGNTEWNNGKIPTHPLECILCRRKTTPSVGMDMDKLESLYTADGNTKWHTHTLENSFFYIQLKLIVWLNISTHKNLPKRNKNICSKTYTA